MRKTPLNKIASPMSADTVNKWLLFPTLLLMVAYQPLAVVEPEIWFCSAWVCFFLAPDTVHVGLICTAIAALHEHNSGAT